MARTIIFTDGSSKGNPGPGGWGAIVAYTEGKERKIRELGGRDAKTTNNRMEMMAVIEGLSFAKKNAPESEIVLNTDSEYVKKGATEWAFAWASNNWRTKANAPVLNRDLWERIIDLVGDLEVDWKVIPGHSGIPANERCDVIATTFADGNPTKLFYGDAKTYHVALEIKPTFGTAKTCPPLSATSGAGRREKSSFGKSTFRGKGAYSYVSAIKGVVKIHKTWAECEERVKGVMNARFRKAMNKEEETNLIKEFTHR